MKHLLKKHWKILLIFLILTGFLLYPPAVLAEIKVEFEDADYGAGRHWKALTSFTENAGLNSVRDTYSKPGKACVFFWDLRFRDGRTLKRMDPIDYDSDNEIRVKAIPLYINGFYAGKLEGEEQDLMAERRIFGRDFAYIRNIMNFSSVVGLYLRRQLDDTP